MLNYIKQAWLQYVIRTIVERVPILKRFFALINGKKTLTGRIIIFLSIVLYGLAVVFPEIPYVAESYAQYMAVMGYILTELGIQHKVDKEAREKLFMNEFNGVK